MPDRPSAERDSLAQTLRNIDRKLPLLTRDQQNLVASYTRGLADGLALRRAEAHPRPPAKTSVRR